VKVATPGEQGTSGVATPPPTRRPRNARGGAKGQGGLSLRDEEIVAPAHLIFILTYAGA